MTCFAKRIERLHASPIREILHVINQPNMISFAGGLPAEDSFPNINDIEIAPSDLQYGSSEGEAELRSWVASDLSLRGLQTDPKHVLILSGSQQGIDLVAKLLVDKGSCVAVESPTYLAALQVFSLFGARYRSFTPEQPLLLLKGAAPALTYVVPTFQNPTSHVYDTDQRLALAETCDRVNTVLFEDDPYRELAYGPCERTPVSAFLKSAKWIYQSSFSKTLAPGLRLGYLTCSPELYPYLVHLKQAADLHSNRVGQRIVLALHTQADYANRLTQIINNYRTKRDMFHNALLRHMAELATWNTPTGGLFFWLNLKQNKLLDTRTLLPLALQQNVAFMPGEPFYPDARLASSRIRLNFSHATDGQIEQGLKKLAEIIAAR